MQPPSLKEQEQEQEHFHLQTPMLLSWHDQLPLFSYRLFEPYRNVTNIISTRLGGVSAAPFSTLNLALSTPDDQESVLENRRRLCAAAGVELKALTVGQLVQGTHIAIVSESIRSLSIQNRIAALQQTDGLITNLPDTPLVILVADCTAVSFFDPVQQVVALTHAGWRGTAGGIVPKMVRLLQEQFGCNPSTVLVGISPNMGKEHFQVRDDVLAIFRQAFGGLAEPFFTPQADGSYLLDLNAALLLQLEQSGILEQHVEVANICTYERTDLFYSHRGEKGKTGRFAGLITLRPTE